MLLRSTIYISHTWFECIILTESWCYHTKAHSHTRITRHTRKFIGILLCFFFSLFHGCFHTQVCRHRCCCHPLSSNPFVFQFIARTSCNYIQLTHRPHLSTTQNHRQLITWKMFIYIYEKKMGKLALAKGVRCANKPHAHMRPHMSTLTPVCMHARTPADTNTENLVLSIYLANRMTIHLISINYIPFTLTNHVVFSRLSPPSPISSLTSFRLFRCACVRVDVPQKK